MGLNVVLRKPLPAKTGGGFLTWLQGQKSQRQARSLECCLQQPTLVDESHKISIALHFGMQCSASKIADLIIVPALIIPRWINSLASFLNQSIGEHPFERSI